ncbi:MAG: type II toxin-antitoxin system RelE/ParE family toxin [Vicinamibacteria bacterium]
MTFQVVTTPEADGQIRTIDSWWRENRKAAPNLFSEELAAGFELLEAVPNVGRSYKHPSVKSVRRILLRSTRYHVYYVVLGNAVVVLSVWSAVRGSGPELKPQP